MLNKQQALQIAEKAIKEMQKSSDYKDFSPVCLKTETDAFFTFVSGSDAMFNDGIVPGAFFVTVDKRDGHLWTKQETEKFYLEASRVSEPQAV